MFEIRKAVRKQRKLRMAITGPTGSGKSFTALRVATAIGRKIIAIDTERRSLDIYARDFDFSVLPLDERDPDTFLAAIEFALDAEPDVLIIDTFSHAWKGVLEAVDQAARRSSSGNTYTAWRDQRPKEARILDAILGASSHVIVTMRSKMEYVLEENDRGKKAPKKVGLAPVQGDGVEYEFDIIGDMDLNHNMSISKTRVSALDGGFFERPGADLGSSILDWLEDGEPPPRRISDEEVEDAIGLMEELGLDEEKQRRRINIALNVRSSVDRRIETLDVNEAQTLLAHLHEKLAAKAEYEAKKNAEEAEKHVASLDDEEEEDGDIDA